MKKSSFLLSCVIALGAMASANAQVFTIDNVSNSLSGPNRLIAGAPGGHTVSIRCNAPADALPASNTYNITNSFVVYSPDGATWDTTIGNNPGMGAGNPFTQFFKNHFGTNGAGRDTVMFAGVGFSAAEGLPATYNNIAFTLLIQSTSIADTGKHICIDSSNGRTAGQPWKWACIGCTPANVFPSWQGPTCYEIFLVPNLNPTFSNCPVNITGSHCAVMQYDFDATDLDGPPPISYSIVSGPGSINASTGAWSYNPSLADVGASITLVVRASDGAGGFSDCSVNIVVTNVGPSITDGCGTTLTVSAGNTVNVDLDATDDCDPLTWSLVESATGAISVDANGTVTYTPDVADAGTQVVTVQVTDGDQTASCDITFNVTLGATYSIGLNGTTGNECALQGQYYTAEVILKAIGSDGIGGFDLLLAYDASALSFVGASEGDIYDNPGAAWEYFQYRYGADGNCSGGCPSGLIRLVGLAEINNGGGNPDTTPTTPISLADLKFLVTDNRTLECQAVAIRFFWLDCGDNTISSASGDITYISKGVFEYADPNTSIANGTVGFPTYLGAQDECTTDPDGAGPKLGPIRDLDLFNGQIRICCADELDDRGDVNLNGLAYEIGDAVVFTNYFIQGIGAFNINVAGQTAATDVNADGSVLTVADLVYIIRVIVGDANPFAKPSVEATEVSYRNLSGTITVDGEIAGMALVVRGNVTPTLEVANSNLELAYGFDGQNTRIIIHPEINRDGYVAGYAGSIVNVGNAEVVSVEMATASGAVVVSKEIPTSYALLQNYPNPFNPKTNIRFAMPVAGKYSLTIYNVAGQVVSELDGTAEAGTVSVEWDASNQASGVYFYKLNAGKFSDTKKMVFIK